MTISFHNVTPAPLSGVIDSGTEVWEKECRFEQGTKYKVVAPSGKGKSTFIHYIYGLRNDYTGEVKLDELSTRLFDADEWADHRQHTLSIVYQDLRLFLHLTAYQNLQVKSVLYNDDQEDRIMAFAKRLNVENLLHKKCQTLSYGERQRIAIIRSLIQPFKWILLDEPFSHLDKENCMNVSALIEEEVSARNAGMIVTSLGLDNYFSYQKQFQL